MYFGLGVKESKRDLFDFESDLEALIRELGSRDTRMIVIKGLRRTGKSSLLRVGLAECGMPYALLDARSYGPFSPDEIYDLMAGSLSRTVEKHRPLKEALRRVRGVSISGVTVNFTARSRSAISEVLERLSDWARKNEQVVLALDEAQDFRLVPGFDKLLAHVYDYLDGIKLVMAGSEVGVLDELLGGRRAKAPLFGRPYFEIEMERLSPERSEEFLRAGFEQLKLRVPQAEISQAIDHFDGIIGWLTNYGYYFSRLGHGRAMNKTLREGSRLVRDELESFLAQRRQARTRYLAVLKMLASPLAWSDVKRGLAAKLGRAVSDKQLSNYLAELVDYGFLVRAENRYALADPLIKHALEGAR